MLRQRIHPGMWPYDFPDDILDWLKRFKEECDLSWAETARRLKTLPDTIRRWKDGKPPQPSARNGSVALVQ